MFRTLVKTDALAIDVFRQARVTAYKKIGDVAGGDLVNMICNHPLKGVGGNYDFAVPLLEGDHVVSGSALVRKDSNDAMARASLSALNRLLGSS